MRSSSSEVGRSFQTRTCPSRPPVAMRWYERPHDGAHEMDVIACCAITSSEMDPVSTGGEGSSERRVIGRREGDSCIIYHTSFEPFARRTEGKSNLHNTGYSTTCCEHLAPVSLLTPGDRPPTVSLTATGASLHHRLLLLLLQRVRNEQSVCGRRPGYLGWSRRRIGMWTRC
jgi:hypothetical protein